MSLPNIPRTGTDWQRRATDAVNYLVNQAPNLVLFVQDQPTAAQSVYGPTYLPVSYTIIQRSCFSSSATAATVTSVFHINIGGVLAGTVTFNAGTTDGVIAFSETEIPALTTLEVIAPTPQDATLSDITIIIALEQ